MSEVFYSQSGMVDVEGGKSTLTMQVKRNIKSQEVTISTSATTIPSVPLQYRRTILIENNGSNPVYVGGADVTVANGFPIYPRGVLRVDIAEDVSICGIVSAATETVRILEGA